MTDVLGPADAGAVNTLTTTTDVTNPTAGDTWFQDCVANNPATGTNLPSRFMNKALQQLRRIIRLAGVPQSNSNDDMLGQAIQSGALNWAGFFGGSANALTGTLSPAPLALIAGMRVGGFVSATNTGAATFNLAGLGGLSLITSAGATLTGGELQSGALVSLRYDGTAWRIESQWPLAFLDARYLRILTVATTFFVNNSSGNASGDTTGDGKTSGTAWFSIAHAITALGAFNLSGNNVTLKLALTGVAYARPGAFNAPSNGTLIILGDAAAQSSYTITGAPATGDSVINVSSGSVQLVGLTIRNTASTGSGLGSSSSQVQIQNVSFTTSVGGQALIIANGGGQITVNAGCTMAGSASAMWAAFNGGSIIQAANCATSGSPGFSGTCMQAANCGIIGVSQTGFSWTGSGATGGKGAATSNGVINSAGSPSFWPGVAAVTVASGGESL